LKKEAKIQEDQVVLVSQYENRIADLENQLRDAMKSQSSSTQNQEEYNAVLQKSELLAQRLAAMEVTVHLLFFNCSSSISLCFLELSSRQVEERSRLLQSQIADEREARKQSDVKTAQLQAENADLASKINTLMEDLTNRLRAKDLELNQRVTQLAPSFGVKFFSFFFFF